jgi:hypothetical protein
MDRSPPDPRALLASWMEWETGETTPGRVMSALKTGGLRDILEAMVAQLPAEAAGGDAGPDEEVWTPVV